MIDVQNLDVDYPDKRVLRGVSFRLRAGSVTALVGENGVGKTTLLRCLAGLERPVRGRITVNGADIFLSPRGICGGMMYLPDNPGFDGALTVRQNLSYAALCHKVPKDEIARRAEDAARDVQMTDMLEKPAGTLSRGYRQRLGLGMALAADPAVLLLDEPASGLDPAARLHLSALLRDLRAKGKTIIVSSHILGELEDYCTGMLVLHDGRLAGHADHGTDPMTPGMLQQAYMKMVSARGAA